MGYVERKQFFLFPRGNARESTIITMRRQMKNPEFCYYCYFIVSYISIWIFNMQKKPLFRRGTAALNLTLDWALLIL